VCATASATATATTAACAAAGIPATYATTGIPAAGVASFVVADGFASCSIARRRCPISQSLRRGRDSSCGKYQGSQRRTNRSAARSTLHDRLPEKEVKTTA
jgi:hypothetical protein